MDSLPRPPGRGPEHPPGCAGAEPKATPEDPCDAPTATSAPAVMQAVGPAWPPRAQGR